MDLSKYADFPDSMTRSETNALFKELLAIPMAGDEGDVIAVLEAMYQLADRQWHTHTLLDRSTRTEVDEWVIRNWDPNSLAKVKIFISIIAHLGLVSSCEMLRRECEKPLPLMVRRHIES